MRKLSRLAFIAATAVLAQGVAESHQRKPKEVTERLRREYDEFPAECEFVSTARSRKRGGNGKGRKWWNN